jgi:hypothetical protein
MNTTTDKVEEIKYCHKCFLKKKANDTSLKIPIFNTVNSIIFNTTRMPEVYAKMEKLRDVPFSSWMELGDDGYSVFHWFIWFISVKIKKYNHIKPRVFAFFQKVLGDNTIKSIFTNKQIHEIVNLINPNKPNHTILYHLVRYCENTSDTYYRRIYDLLINIGSPCLTCDQLANITTINVGDENLPNDLKYRVSDITNAYKSIEELIIKNIDERHNDFKLNKCVECGMLIDYTKDLPKIITFAKLNDIKKITNLIQYAFYLRKLLNKIFDNYYKMNGSNSDLNMIHRRHNHVLEIYTENLYAVDMISG